MNWIRHILKTHGPLIFSAVLLMAGARVPHAHAEKSFFIDRPKLGLGGIYKFEEEYRTLSDIQTKTITHDWREYMTLQTNGWVYHPNLMKYRLSFEPEWRQEIFRHSQTAWGFRQTDRQDTSVLAYDVLTTFLAQKPCSLDVFSNRSTRQIDLSYTQDTDIETETWGGRLNYKNPVMPVSVSFINRQSDQTGFYRSDEDRNQMQIRIGHNAKRSVSELNILRDDTKKTTRTGFETIDSESDASNAEFTNTYFFTDDERGRLDSFLYLAEAEYNDVRMDTRLLTENFFWNYGKNLLTQYTVDFNRREISDFDVEEKGFKALLTHHLGDTLTTNLGGGVTLNDFAGGGEDRYRSNLGFIYHRPIPSGRIELGAAYDYGITNRNGAGNMIPTEERHTLTSTEGTFLREENISVESIVVTDITGAIVYTENIDYRVFEVGTDLRISRTLMGGIAEGQEVIVRYSYRLDGGYDDARFGQDYHFDLGLWSFLNLTCTHRRLNQTNLSGDTPSDRLDKTFNSARLRFEFGWLETRFEYEKQDREYGSSFTTKSVSELIKFKMPRSLSLNFSGDLGKREFTDPGEEETFYTIGADVGWTPQWWYTVSMVCLRSKISGERQDTVYSEFSPKIRLTYGVWSASLTYRLTDQQERDFDNELWRQQVYCIVSRSLW